MNNKEWDLKHKEFKVVDSYDKDLDKFLKRFYMSDKEPKAILDLACGQGRNIDYMSKSYDNWSCHGCDFSAKALCITNGKLIGRDNVALRQCNAYNTGYMDMQFDLVVSVFLDVSKDIIKEIYRILKPKGKIFIKDSGDQIMKWLKDTGFDGLEMSVSDDHCIFIGRKK